MVDNFIELLNYLLADHREHKLSKPSC